MKTLMGCFRKVLGVGKAVVGEELGSGRAVWGL